MYKTRALKYIAHLLPLVSKAMCESYLEWKPTESSDGGSWGSTHGIARYAFSNSLVILLVDSHPRLGDMGGEGKKNLILNAAGKSSAPANVACLPAVVFSFLIFTEGEI